MLQDMKYGLKAQWRNGAMVSDIRKMLLSL
jgi:hypothetical protein